MEVNDLKRIARYRTLCCSRISCLNIPNTNLTLFSWSYFLDTFLLFKERAGVAQAVSFPTLSWQACLNPGGCRSSSVSKQILGFSLRLPTKVKLSRIVWWFCDVNTNPPYYSFHEEQAATLHFTCNINS